MEIVILFSQFLIYIPPKNLQKSKCQVITNNELCKQFDPKVTFQAFNDCIRAEYSLIYNCIDASKLSSTPGEKSQGKHKEK